MVNYVRPRHIGKRALANSNPYKFNAARLSRDAPEPRTPTCLRCLANIAKGTDECAKPEDERCQHCKDGHRSACTLIPREFYSRYELLYTLRDRYNTAVAACATPAAAKADPTVQATGLKLARAQRGVTKALTASRRLATRSGQSMAAATANPTTTQDFLALILAEQRGIRTAMESIAASQKTRAATAGGNDSDDDDDDDDDEEGSGAGGNAGDA